MASVKDIVRALQMEIAAGTWKAGDALPPQPVLAERFSAHPQTIGKALRELTADGILEPPRGRTKIVRVAVERAVSDRTCGFFEDPAWNAPRIETLETVVKSAPAEVAQYFDTPKLLRWLALQKDGREVVSICEGWYRPHEWLRQFTLRPSPDIEFYRALQDSENTHIERFQEWVTAHVASEQDREYFNETGRAPLVIVDILRIAWGTDGRALEVCRLRNRASRYRIRYDIGSHGPR